MVRRAMVACLALVAMGVALAGEPHQPQPPHHGQPGGEPNPEMEAQRRQMEMMQRMRMLPGVPHQIVQFWQEVDPETLEEMRRHFDANPQERQQLIQRAMEETRHLAEMRGRDPEGFELVLQERRLSRHARGLGEQLRAAKEAAEKERITGELRATLEQLFEVREAVRAREIKGLEDRVKELQALAKKRRAHKAEIIDHKIKELSGELDYLKW